MSGGEQYLHPELPGLLSPDPAISPAAEFAAIAIAGQVPPPPVSGHPRRRRDGGHPGRRTPGDGLSRLAAVDDGSDKWVSFNGDPGAARRHRSPDGTLCHDFVECLAMLFHDGFDVATEASTPFSFRMRGREFELVDVLDRSPDRTLYTIGSHMVQNELRRQGIEYNAATDHHVAAATIWLLAERHRPKVWRPPDPTEQPYRIDPLRPNIDGFIQLRNDGYPSDRLARDVWSFLPNIAYVTLDQRRILLTGPRWRRAGDFHPARTSALIFSLREPLSRSRQGWERVIGASCHGRPSAYRQVLSVGKPRADYRYGYHVTGLSMTDATRALRGLRSLILTEHPELIGDSTWRTAG